MWAWLAEQRLQRRQPHSENALARELGVDQKTVVGWRHGATPDSANLQRLAALMGVDGDWLLDPAETWETRDNSTRLSAVLSGIPPEEKRAIIEAVRDPRMRRALAAYGATLRSTSPPPPGARGPR